jgi:hypothetical protein
MKIKNLVTPHFYYFLRISHVPNKFVSVTQLSMTVISFFSSIFLILTKFILNEYVFIDCCACEKQRKQT